MGLKLLVLPATVLVLAHWGLGLSGQPLAVMAPDLAERTGIPPRYLEQILMRLRVAGVDEAPLDHPFPEGLGGQGASVVLPQRLARGLDLSAAFTDRHRIGIVGHDQRHLDDAVAVRIEPGHFHVDPREIVLILSQDGSAKKGSV